MTAAGGEGRNYVVQPEVSVRLVRIRVTSLSNVRRHTFFLRPVTFRVLLILAGGCLVVFLVNII